MPLLTEREPTPRWRGRKASWDAYNTLLAGFPREDVLEKGFVYFRDVDGLTYTRCPTHSSSDFELYCIRVTDTETGDVLGYL